MSTLNWPAVALITAVLLIPEIPLIVLIIYALKGASKK